LAGTRVDPLLDRGEQVDQHGGEPGYPQLGGDVAVTRAVPAAAAAMGEQYEPTRRLRYDEVALEHHPGDQEAHARLRDTRARRCAVRAVRAVVGCSFVAGGWLVLGAGARGAAQELSYLVVGGLAEVPVRGADRKERRRRARADHLVHDRGQVPTGRLRRGGY